MMNHTRIAAILVATILTTASATLAQDSYRVTSGRIAVACSLTVGGGFEATTKSLSGELNVPQAAGAASLIQGTLQSTFRRWRPASVSAIDTCARSTFRWTEARISRRRRSPTFAS